MVKAQALPDDGELVVGTVKEVKGFGAFITLDEYPGKEGFLHIAEVAAGWVKYVRDHVRENQKIVVKVVNVDQHKGHIDVSLKRVNDHQRREKIAEWKNESKAEKLLEILGERLGRPKEDLVQEFGVKLVDVYGSLYAAFEAAAIDGEEDLTNEGFSGEWLPALVALAQENIQIPFVTIKGYLDLHSWNKDAVADLREALESAQETEYEDVDITVEYIGAPKYRVKVKAPDYKAAEEELRAAADRALKIIHKRGGDGTFDRGEEKG